MWGRRPVLELLKAGAAVERVLIARESSRSPVVNEIRRRARSAGVPVRDVPRNEIERRAHGANHQGVIAVATSYRYSSLDRLFRVPEPLVLFLDGVTDPHNVGSLLRSADGAGFTGMVVSSRRSSGITAAVRRVAAGAAEVVPVARVASLGVALDVAKGAGLWVAGLDAAGDSDLWHSEVLEPPLGLVVGSEEKGISASVRQRCDVLVRIPSGGKIASLNVAVAGAVGMFEVARRRGRSATLSEAHVGPR